MISVAMRNLSRSVFVSIVARPWLGILDHKSKDDTGHLLLELSAAPPAHCISSFELMARTLIHFSNVQ